jgi:hypothetical protein
MKESIIWEYDPIKTKDGSPSESILYGGGCFIITTQPNRIASTNLNNASKVTLLYKGQYTQHRYWGTLEQMKSLAQQIKDNQNLFNRFIYLDCEYSNADGNWWGEDIDFNAL